ncbi:MAG: hypothetical protein N2653_08090 [Burkholderiales bacterium]|nr:hypothetical protein [Burkholderiales bacterium]
MDIDIRFDTQAAAASLLQGEEAYRERLIETLTRMSDDAHRQNRLHIFVDVAVWNLAGIAHMYGARGTGQIVRRFGEFLLTFEERIQAEREAEREREAGRKPQ